MTLTGRDVEEVDLPRRKGLNSVAISVENFEKKITYNNFIIIHPG